MPTKKKKRPSKKKIIKEEIAIEAPKRKLIPFTPLETAVKPGIKKMSLTGFTAGRLPSVAKSMPPVASAIPLVSKEIPLVSKPIPLVSAKPNITLPRHWGIMPSKKWGGTKMRPTRRRELTRPKDIGLFKFLGKVVTAPFQPVEMVTGITDAIHAQTQEEREPKVALEQELLELKMCREMGKISEDDYKIQETNLKGRIKDLEEKEKKEEAKKVKETPARERRAEGKAKSKKEKRKRR